jgi:hypothetical protein
LRRSGPSRTIKKVSARRFDEFASRACKQKLKAPGFDPAAWRLGQQSVIRHGCRLANGGALPRQTAARSSPEPEEQPAILPAATRRERFALQRYAAMALTRT